MIGGACYSMAMDLDTRLKTVASGVSVADAIESYLDSADAPPSEASRPTDELRATVELMFLMAAVDGEVSDVELAQLRASVEAIVDIEKIPDLDLDGLIAELGDKLDAEGWTARLRNAAAGIRSDEGKAFAFRLAAAVAFVDDFVAHAEAAAIDSLGHALGIEKEAALGLLRDVHETLFPTG